MTLLICLFDGNDFYWHCFSLYASDERIMFQQPNSFAACGIVSCQFEKLKHKKRAMNPKSIFSTDLSEQKPNLRHKFGPVNNDHQKPSSYFIQIFLFFTLHAAAKKMLFKSVPEVIKSGAVDSSPTIYSGKFLLNLHSKNDKTPEKTAAAVAQHTMKQQKFSFSAFVALKRCSTRL